MPALQGNLTELEYAKWHLRQILEDATVPYKNTDDKLETELELDKIGTFYLPWWTGARILEYTEYEVTDGLNSRRLEKIKALRRLQFQIALKMGIPTSTLVLSGGASGGTRGVATARYIVK